MFILQKNMDNILPIFKSWVPEWLIKVILFSVLLPCVVLFFLPLSNLNAAAGYYGCEIADIQFSVALFYSGYVGFYSLERRFFSFLATKEYFILFTFLNIITTLICYLTNEINILFPIRFIQGMLFASSVNLSLSVIFTRLHTERAREIGFSVFFGMILIALPFNNLITADLIDSYNFNSVFKGALFSFLPGFFMLIVSMNNIRFNIKFPLKNLDWQSFSIYTIILILIGYITIYGQEYYWLNDKRIKYSFITIVVLCILYFIRQQRMKRPYINLLVFKFRNFNIGVILLFVMYICRFSVGITNNFFTAVLKFDPIHLSYINLFNLIGLITGVVISCTLLIQRKPIRYVWLPGFFFLLIFHFLMFYLFDVYGDNFNYYIPLLLQGLGVGMIMVPTIIYAISSVPVSLGPSASAICLAIRYFGFCASIALLNYFELFEKSKHYNTFQNNLTLLNPVVKQYLSFNNEHLLDKGLVTLKSVKASSKLLINNLNQQNNLRYAMDYYTIMIWILFGTLLLIIVFPYLNKTVVYLRSKVLSPA